MRPPLVVLPESPFPTLAAHPLQAPAPDEIVHSSSTLNSRRDTDLESGLSALVLFKDHGGVVIEGMRRSQSKGDEEKAEESELEEGEAEAEAVKLDEYPDGGWRAWRSVAF